MDFTTSETDYLLELLTNHLMALLSRVTRWQTHSLSQQQYDRQVQETLLPELAKLTALRTKLVPTASASLQVGALDAGLLKLKQAATYQLTPVQLAHANERRLNRHRR